MTHYFKNDIILEKYRAVYVLRDTEIMKRKYVFFAKGAE